MDRQAYRDYAAESANWLKRGRAALLEGLLLDAAGKRCDLKLLDLGAGVGQNIPVLAQFGSVDAVEMNPIGIDALKATPSIRKLYTLPIPFDCDERYDVIVATDVLEHIKDDRAAAEWVAGHLVPGGLFVSTVPAYQWLFSEHDVALHHFRRYTTASYARVMPAEIEISKQGYFNSFLFPAAAALRLANQLSRRKPEEPARKQSANMPPRLDSLFGRVLEAEIALIRRFGGLPFGLSVYCVGHKCR